MMWTTAIVAVLIYLFYIWMKRTFTFWTDRGVKGPQPLPFFGNFGKVFTLKESMDCLLWNMYKRFPEEKVVGFYMGYKPTLLIKDPDMLKHILIKDFSTFQDRGLKKHDEDKFDDNLFITEGETWRMLRHKLTPIFTSGKLRTMIPLIEKCIDGYLHYVDKLIDSDKDHEIRDLVSKYTLEVIGTCAFGVDMRTFTDGHNPFYQTAKQIFTPSIYRKTLATLDFFIPNFTLFMKKYLKVAPNTSLKHFFMKLVNEIVKEREGKKKIRNDFMDLMIELKEQGKIEKKVPDGTVDLVLDTEILAAQALVFFAAGFESSSATMSFLMYELALHPEIQQRVYEDILEVTEKNNGRITYDSIKQLTYLEMCFDETLRKYPVVGTLIRKSTENYKIPDSEYTVEKNMTVMISALGLHRDPRFFKNPDVFDPERFSEENKQSITRFAYLPFGEGPRNCIGMRFAKVQSMLGMAAFLRKFKVEKSSKTLDHLEFNPRGVTLTSKEGIWLKINRR